MIFLVLLLFIVLYSVRKINADGEVISTGMFIFLRKYIVAHHLRVAYGMVISIIST
jgi:hypothetical protein